MSSHKLALFLALLVSATAPAFATSGTSYASTNFGFSTHSMPPSTLTRAQVQAELADWNKKMLAYRRAGIAAGFDQNGYANSPVELHTYELVNGSLTHVDAVPHNTSRPGLAMSAQEKRQQREMYGNY